MKPLRTIWLRIRSLWQRREVKREIDEELRLHPDMRGEVIEAGHETLASADTAFR